MKFIVIIILFLSSSNDLKLMRNEFNQINKSEEAVVKLKQLSTTTKEVSDALKLAYYAAAEMTSAKYKLNPASKISAFNSGKKILETAIAKDANNIEIRYIRFTIQSNAPSILGYNKNTTDDKNFIFKNLQGIKKTDIELFANISAYFLTQVKLTEQEKKIIND